MLYAFLGLLLLGGCSSAFSGLGSKSDSNSNFNFQKSLLREQLAQENERYIIGRESQAHYYFVRGELALASEDYEAAREFYELASEKEAGPAPLLRRRLAELQIRAEKLDEAEEQLKLALKKSPDDVELLQLHAGVLATLGKRDEAVTLYERIIEVSGGEKEDPYILIASLYLQDGELEKAEGTLTTLVEKRPDSFFGHYYLARLYEASNETEKALSFYKKAVELNPNNDTLKLQIARVKGSLKQYPEAIQICEDIIKANPGNVEARTLRGQLLLAQDKVEEALAEFEKLGAIEEDPTDTRFKIALIKLQRRDFEGAQVELSLILAKDAENMAARYYLGSAYAGMGMTNKAVAELKKIGPGEKYFVEARTLSAYLLRQSGDAEGAVEILEEASVEAKENVRLLSLLVSLQREIGNLRGAIKTTSRLSELQPKKDKNLFTLAVLYDELGEKENAIKWMRKTIELNPSNANALNYLGYTLAELGDSLESAEEYIKKAIELEPNNGYFIDSLGWVYFKKGKYQKAHKQLARAAELVSGDAVIIEHLGLAEEKLGNKEKAIELLEKALELAPQSDDKEAEQRILQNLERLRSRP